MSRFWLFLGLALMVGAIGCGRKTDSIVVVSRQNNSGTYEYFREAVLGADREFRLGTVDQNGSKEVVELVAHTPMAIGYSGMGYATPEVKMLEVSSTPGSEAVKPTMENAKNGTYPLSRPLYIYTLGEPTGAVKQFIDWIMSPEGQEVVVESGYVPVEPVPLTEEGQDQDAIIKVAGSDTMVNLAGLWSQKFNVKYPGIKPQVAGGGSGTGIAKLINGTTDLCNASREMKPEEIEEAEKNAEGKKVKQYVVATDALAVYVHKDNPLESIAISELAEIYGEGGTITQWSQVTGWPANGEQ